MPRATAQRSLRLTAPPKAVWSVACRFTENWHPDIAQIEAIADGHTRRFTVTGDNTVYEERLTYYSGTDMTLSYTHLRGIDGVQDYVARLTVAPASTGGSVVSWHADIVAPAPRHEEIARGTEFIFERGLKALDALARNEEPVVEDRAEPKPSDLERRSLGQAPRLSFLTTPRIKSADTLCLFLHGIGGAAANWRAQLQRFGEGIAVAALDMRGYGESTLGFAPSTMDDYCDDIQHVLDAFSAKRVVLCGLSMGAWIATSFALRYPDKIAGLVLAGGCTGMSEASPKERENFRVSREVPLSQGQTPADFADGVVNVIAGPSANHAVRDEMRASMAAIPAASYGDALQCFCNPLETFDFTRVDFPVLMMTGEHDRLAPPDEIRAVSQRIHDLAQAIPDVRFEMLPDTGHVCNLENPTEFNRHLAAFFQRIDGLKPVRRSAVREEKHRQKHKQILDAAHIEFTENGFDGASMDRLAEAAGVSKPTLYKYFGDKEGLFAAVLDQGRSHIVTPLADVSAPLVESLWNFSWNYADFVLRPDMLSLARLILGEAGRRPESVAQYHRFGPGKALSGIVAFIEAKIKDGALIADNSRFAAQDLWSLILSGPRDYYLHHVNEQPTREELTENISHGLSLFLRNYSTNPQEDLNALRKLAQQDQET